MPKINELTRATALTGTDLLPMDNSSGTATKAVSGDQIKAYVTADVAADVTDLKNALRAETSARQSADASLQSNITGVGGRVTNNEADVSGIKNTLNYSKSATPGYVLRASNAGNGSSWEAPGTPTDEQVQEVVDAWMDNHSGAYVVPDESLSNKKLIHGTLGYVTPEMYGAVGDGVTDDTVAINAALSSGYDVYFSGDKTYLLCGIAEVKSNTHIQIDGTVLMGKTGNCGFELFNRNNAVSGYNGVHDVLIDGSGKIDGNVNLANATAALIRLGHCNNVTVAGITICNYHVYHAVEIAGSNNVTFDDVHFYGAIYDNTLSYTIEVINIEYISEDGSNGAVSYDGTDSKNITIRNCIFDNANDTSWYMAIGCHHADYSGDHVFDNLLIENCKFLNQTLNTRRYTGNHRYGHAIVLDSVFTNVAIRNNYFENLAGSGIWIGNNSKNIEVSGNSFNKVYYDCVLYGTGVDGLTISENTVTNSPYADISGTTENRYSAINLGAAGTNISVFGNQFNIGSQYEMRPIYVSASTYDDDEFSVTGNTYQGFEANLSNTNTTLALYTLDIFDDPVTLFQANGVANIVKTGSVSFDHDARLYKYLAIEYATENGTWEVALIDTKRLLGADVGGSGNRAVRLMISNIASGTLTAYQLRGTIKSTFKSLAIEQNRKITLAGTVTDYSNGGQDQVFIGIYSVKGLNLKNHIM